MRKIIILSLLYLFSNASFSKPSIASNSTILHQTDSIAALCINQYSQDSIKSYIEHLAGYQTRYMLSPSRRDIAMWLRDKFIATGYNNTVIDSFECTIYTNPDTTLWQYNVVAELEGELPSNSYAVIGAHYDSYSNTTPMISAPGADDNGSGTAAVLETARCMKAINYLPRYTIKFALFGAEELMFSESKSGAAYFVEKALNAGENIFLYINNDMIAHSTYNVQWPLKIIHHDSLAPETHYALDVCNKFTSIKPIDIYTTEGSADEYYFWKAGFSSIYFFEEEFSPYYHSPMDTPDHCNMPFCTDVAKLNGGTLIKMVETPMPVKNLFIQDAGDGIHLTAHWSPNNEPDLAGYRIYQGTQHEIYDTTYFTTDTSMLITTNGELTYLALATENKHGISSLLKEKCTKPAHVTLQNGILILRDTQGCLDETYSDEDIDSFYDYLCHDFQHQNTDISTISMVDLDSIGKWSAILWHGENIQWDTKVLANSLDAIRNYINLGGKIMFSLYKPSVKFGYGKEHSKTYQSPDFFFDYLHIAASDNPVNRWFCGAIPAISPFKTIHTDSTRFEFYDYHLTFIEQFVPTIEGDIIYRYNTKFDTTTTQGSSYGKPVAIMNSGETKNTVITSFPLFYMDSLSMKKMVNHVMRDLFYVSPIGVEDIVRDNPMTLYPNPATQILNLRGHFNSQEKITFLLYSAQGNLIFKKSLQNHSTNEEITIILPKLPKGIYLSIINNNGILYKQKTVIQ